MANGTRTDYIWINRIQKLGGCVFSRLTLDLSRGVRRTNMKKKKKENKHSLIFTERMPVQ